MTENETIKALKRMSEEDPNGFSSDILDLINRKKAEKEELEFELIRSRNEMKAWKIRASWYKEKSSKLECKNSELEIELKAMRGAANSYKSDVERLNDLVAFNASCCTSLHKDLLNAKAEARKEFAERFMIEAAKILEINTIYWMREIKNNLLAEMEERK